MDLPGRVSSRLVSKRAALSTLNNNAAGPESDSSSKSFKRARNTSRVPSRAFSGVHVQHERDARGLGESGASAKQQEFQKPLEVPAEGVNPLVGAGADGRPKERANTDTPSKTAEAESVRAAVGEVPNNQGGEGFNAEASKEAADVAAGDGVASGGVPARAANETDCTGAKDGAAQQPADAGAANDANAGGGTQGQATNVGGSSDVNCGWAQQDTNEGVPRQAVNQAGPGRCTYTRCTHVRGKEGETPDELRREGASKACRTCGACLHNLCCQEITGREGDFICENCPKGAQHGGGMAPPNGRRYKYKAKRKGPTGVPSGGRRMPQQRTGAGETTPAATAPQTTAGAGNPGREGRNGGKLGVVACPKCSLKQASGRKFCQDVGCKAPIREARAAAKHAAELEAMKAAEEADGFSMTSASKSVHEFAKKRLLIASGGRAEGVLMFARRDENGERRFRFYGMGEAATVFAKNPTLQGSFKTHMDRSYKQEDEARERAARAEEGPSPNDVEVDDFLKGLGSAYVKYAEMFQAEGFTMAALKLAKDDNLAALGIRMGPRIRIMAAASAYQITESEPRKTTPAKSGGRASVDSSDEKDMDSGDESDAGVL